MTCPEDIHEFMDFDLPAFTQSAGCDSLYAAIEIAQMHIIKISLDPCAFDGLEFQGSVCSGEQKIRSLNALIRTWLDIIKCKVSTQHLHQRRPQRRYRPCYGRSPKKL